MKNVDETKIQGTNSYPEILPEIYVAMFRRHVL